VTGVAERAALIRVTSALGTARRGLLGAMLVAVGCSGATTGASHFSDAGSDAVSDAAPEAGTDAASEAGTDATEEASSVPVALAEGIVEASLIALDDEYVYFTSTGENVNTTGKVQRVPKAGGAVDDLVTGLGVPYGIAVDATYVYFTDRLANALDRVPKSGGTATPIATNQPHCNRIALGGGNIFWTNSGASEDHDGSLMKMPIGGGTPVALATALPDPEAVAVDATNVYWVNTAATEPGTVMRTKIDGSQAVPTTLATGLDYPLGIALDTTTVYWAHELGVMKVAKTSDGSIAPTYLATNQNESREVAVDSVTAYWTNQDAVAEVPLAGGSEKTLGVVVWGDGIALDDAYVYYVDSGTLTKPGAIYRVAK
jgi:hypothetical protein